jgi:ACR3 family arsenite transporter
MNTSNAPPGKAVAKPSINFFERYLTVWVRCASSPASRSARCCPACSSHRPDGSRQVNLPVGLLIWVMIIPMLVKVDFGACTKCASTSKASASRCRQLARQAVFDGVARLAVHPPSVRADAAADQLDSYIAGLILLAAAPCTAMVFVWSRLTGGDPLFTLSQVALNDSIMVIAFAPLVGLLLGMSAITVPWATLLTSVVLYIVIPVIMAQLCASAAREGQAAFDAAMAKIGPGRSRRCWPRWCCCSRSRAKPS